MGNQLNKIGKEFSFVQCKIEELDYSVQREVQNEFYSNSSNKQIRMRNTKGLKNLSHKKLNLPIKRQNQSLKRQQQQNHKQNQPVGNYKRTINAQNKRLHFQNESNPNVIHQQMEKAYKFMKSLNVLERFEQKYNKEYPMLILNKDPSIKKLRHEILKEKQNHTYFHSQMKYQRHPQRREEYTWNNKEGNQHVEKRKKNEEQVYNNFVILEIIEWVLIRLFQTGRHCTVLKHLKDLDMDYQLNCREDRGQKVGQCMQMIDRLVKEVNAVDIELMDMLFYQLNQTQYQSSQDQFETQYFSNERIPSFNQNLINVKELIMKNKQTHKITNKNYHKGYQQQQQLKSSKQQQQLNEYESCKELGWQIYKQNKVCFYILAVGNYTFCPQLQPLNIPLNLTIIQVLLDKYDAFAQLLQLNQMNVNILIDTKRTLQLNEIIQKNDNKWQRLNIRVLKTQELPLLDIEGNFIVNKKLTQKINNKSTQKINSKGISTRNQKHIQTVMNQKSIRMGSIGSVDVWNCIEEDLNQLQQFQYIQVIETRNCLQMGFDCFLLGKINKQNLQFTTKLFQPLQRLTELTFINSNKSLINSQSNKLSKSPSMNDFPQLSQPILSFSPFPSLIYPSQTHYVQYLQYIKQKQYPYYAYRGHSLISVSFAKKLLNKTKNKQKSKFRIKTYLQNNQKFLTFQRDFLDLPIQSIMQTNYEESKIHSNKEDHIKWMMFLYERDNSYYPLNFRQNQGIFDIQGCSKTLNMDSLFKLDLSFNKFLSNDWMKTIKCYIDPHVSLEGEGLQEIKLEIERRINEILTEKKLCQYQEGKSKVPLQKGERKQQQKGGRSQQTQEYKFQQDLSGYQRLKGSGIERKESLIERIEEQISNSQLLPSHLISSISQIIVLLSSNKQTQKQISIFIN